MDASNSYSNVIGNSSLTMSQISAVNMDYTESTLAIPPLPSACLNAASASTSTASSGFICTDIDSEITSDEVLGTGVVPPDSPPDIINEDSLQCNLESTRLGMHFFNRRSDCKCYTIFIPLSNPIYLNLQSTTV